ncbi:MULTISPECIES: DSD1 family PLP-dependent enzyme [unclassified Brenneria]|uniref:DSD1 family PLP-dependent enzyme n=1 Tax=unclassified Brenneria TaxID=2634434 RepID=UPI001557DB98|nr:DSD1 family PLP-dependent enzyme [Brenneria sp. hezel4-2-4]MEE3649754.1 DSD1 family PLP-dependent enzyme [Brenneria sp. HEZEL_4_2_4]NPC99713.1 DSD1 family PLP-dependent enzyme [Brenneria sp. hezel4-2-4]
MSDLLLLQNINTPFLLIDEYKYQRNIDRLYERIEKLGSQVRPHLKTLRSLEASRYLLKNPDSPATVSTLAEAEAFAAAGYTNLLYAVGIAPHKLERVTRLMKQGVNIHILLDSPEQARAVSAFASDNGVIYSVFIEVDCDGHRGGIPPESEALTELAQLVHGNGAVLTGLLAHAGESYNCRTDEQIRQAARNECDAIRAAAARIRAKGIACPVLSVGATPTAHFAEDLSGIAEVRAGVFTCFDLVMKNVGVCNIDDIAISVVASVIGHNRDKNWVFIDAGWMAMSRDRGTATQPTDYGYGLVCDMDGKPLDVCLTTTNQEHGIIALPVESTLKPDDFPVGSRLRILPNHACATAAMHQQYQVLSQDNGGQGIWHRIMGW